MDVTVLVIDDAAALRTQLVQLLRALPNVAHVLEAADGLQGFLAMRRRPVDLVLCDLIMPGVDGFKFLALVHGEASLRDVPVIMLTGEEDVAAKVRGLQAGASDYLTKPFDVGELTARVRVHLKIKALQDELRQKNAALEQLVRVDALTGLHNRRSLEEQLRQEFLRAERYKTTATLAMVDVDHFKRVNDAFGHPVGDRALAAVAEALQHSARVQDVVARYGGEEFCILMPHTDAHGAALAAERHRTAVASMPPVAEPGPERLTVSIGIAEFPRPDVHGVEAWVALADAALYRAKQEGRNRVAAAPPPAEAPPAPPPSPPG